MLMAHTLTNNKKISKVEAALQNMVQIYFKPTDYSIKKAAKAAFFIEY